MKCPNPWVLSKTRPTYWRRLATRWNPIRILKLDGTDLFRGQGEFYKVQRKYHFGYFSLVIIDIKKLGLWPPLDFTKKNERHECANCFFIISFTSVSAEYQFARAKSLLSFLMWILKGTTYAIRNNRSINKTHFTYSYYKCTFSYRNMLVTFDESQVFIDSIPNRRS